MCDGNNFKKMEEMLNELRNKRDEMVFIGGNYDKDNDKFNDLKKVIDEIGLIPIIAKEVYKDIDPSRIHDESLRLLHNCGFAVIDITNPAGQLMELERARDYGVVTFVSYSSRHPSKMPITLAKAMENWGLGYLFNYETFEGLKKFVRSILLINHLKGYTPEEILTKIIGEKPKELFLITSIGVLTTEKETEEKESEKEIKNIKELLKKFDKRIIITGWDFQTQGRKEAEKYEADLIACEGGCILYKKNYDFREAEDYCDENSVRLVKIANRCIIRAINEYRKEKDLEQVVFYSQADKKSICYYLNPPENIREGRLNKMKKETGLTVNDFAEKVKGRCEILPKSTTNRKVEYEKPQDPQTEETLLYAIEKVNAVDRTFLPYSITIDENKIQVHLLSDSSNYREFTYRDIENIVEKGFTKINYEKYYEQLYTKILPQKDICIDILCKSKDEILIPLLKKVVKEKDKENTLVIYLSKGTESDIPMIFKGYSSGYNFIAIGDDNISDRLKRAGVIPLGKSTTEVIGKILEIKNKEV